MIGKASIVICCDSANQWLISSIYRQKLLNIQERTLKRNKGTSEAPSNTLAAMRGMLPAAAAKGVNAVHRLHNSKATANNFSPPMRSDN